MKRLAALLLLLTLLLTACGTPPAPQGSAASQSAASAPSSSVPPAAPPDSSQPEDAPQNEPYALPEGFVLLADAVPDILQEIRYYSTYNFVGSRIDGYEQPCAILTVEAAQALRAVSDELVPRTMEAARRRGRRTIVAAGGVAANSVIRADLQAACNEASCTLFVPPLALCGDNGAMIGAQGYYEYLAGRRGSLSLNAYATMDLNEQE